LATRASRLHWRTRRLPNRPSKDASPMRRSFIPGAILVLALLLAGAAPLVGAARPASQPATPAAVGTPADLAAAGLPGYGVVRGNDLSLADAAGLYASARKGDPAQIQSTLKAAGF